MPGPRIGVDQNPRVPIVTSSSIPTFIQLFSGSRIYSGSGVPSATLGRTGDFFYRKDGGGAGLTHIYVNNAGWIGIA